jgi:Flp pilus assembly pilin Flp
MSKTYMKTIGLIQRLRSDEEGVVSFEYVIVAACVVAVVIAAFGTTGTGPLGTALTTAINDIATAVENVVTG